MPTPTPALRQRENFLAEAVGPRERKLTYTDGFRFGLGFMIAGLLLLLVVGGLAWGLVITLGMR